MLGKKRSHTTGVPLNGSVKVHLLKSKYQHEFNSEIIANKYSMSKFSFKDKVQGVQITIVKHYFS